LFGFVRERKNIPSSIPKPERRIGTIEIVEGAMVVVVYSYPSGVLACIQRRVRTGIQETREELP
jgi:hypothetical protein